MSRRQGGWDLTCPRPWRAVPMDPANPQGAWQVLCRSLVRGRPDVVMLTRLSEFDAKSIAASPEIDPRSDADNLPPPFGDGDGIPF